MFMQTGTLHDARDNSVFLEQLHRILILLAEDATKTAATFCDMCGRTLVTPGDMRLALRVQCHEFLDNTEDLEERLQEMVREEEESGEEASGEEESGEEASGEEASGEEGEASGEEASGEEASGEEGEASSSPQFVRGNRALYDRWIEYDRGWDAWRPSDEVRIFMKRCLDTRTNA